jgi:hypothetical protein
MRKLGCLFYDSGTHRLGVALRGHLLLFDRRKPPAYPAAAGVRLLVLFALLELIIGPRGQGLAWLGLSAPASGIDIFNPYASEFAFDSWLGAALPIATMIIAEIMLFFAASCLLFKDEEQ